MDFLDHFRNIKQPLLLGFLISLIGSLPFGYINLVGLQILLKKGDFSVIMFVLGIVFIEYIVLQIVGIIAKSLIQQKKILIFIDLFMILFFLSLGLFFLKRIGQETELNSSEIPFVQYSFFLGVVLNSFNLMQWPYWSSVYLYLYRSNKLSQNTNNSQFVWGALSGTFAGILCFDYVLKYLIIEYNMNIKPYSDTIFAILFTGMSIIQLSTLIWKRYFKA